ncbi:hypothetical protein C6W92_16800 [Roseovarius sp. A46]|nr:hypothetical protein C6W92_16800 [Roseovarius sp. A46]
MKLPQGQINRLKTLKRPVYGNAGPELLRARMLPLPHRLRQNRVKGNATTGEADSSFGTIASYPDRRAVSCPSPSPGLAADRKHPW